MKKIKRLKLTSETIRVLTDVEMVRGGDDGNRIATNTSGCIDGCYCPTNAKAGCPTPACG